MMTELSDPDQIDLDRSMKLKKDKNYKMTKADYINLVIDPSEQLLINRRPQKQEFLEAG